MSETRRPGIREGLGRLRIAIGNLRLKSEVPQSPYDTSKYYTLTDGRMVLDAHKKLAVKHRPRANRSLWYWNRSKENPGQSYHEEQAGQFTIITAHVDDMPRATMAVWVDTMSKSFMDQKATGEQLQDQKSIEERERQVANFSFMRGKDLLVTAVAYNGRLIGGGMRDIGESNKSIGNILQSPDDGERHLATFTELAQAHVVLP